MNTLRELLSYCKELEPVGALLLTGEWGCGKTYIIENDLKKALSSEAVVLRISLFGISSADEIHHTVKKLWLEEYSSIVKIKTVTKRFEKSKAVISKLDFLPEWIKGIANTDITSFISIKNKIKDKTVILVFDDLERCHMNSADVLGIINDYCENQKYHTIIVANQEKIITKQDQKLLTGEIQYELSMNSDDKTDKKKAIFKVHKDPQQSSMNIPYTEIKEKIIQRTVQYIPNYPQIVHKIIETFQCKNKEYESFIKGCEDGLVDLFTPDRDNLAIVNKEKTEEPSNNQSEKFLKMPYNIRSLKCAISDFYRVYVVLRENEFDNIDSWFYSFTIYLILYKADIIKESDIITDEDDLGLFSAFQNRYMFNSVKEWIHKGVWNEDAVLHEIEDVKKRQAAKKPCEIIRVNRIMDIDEDVIKEGFSEFLKNVYTGQLSLDDYILFVENSRWARYFDYNFPITIDWNRVKNGVEKCIEAYKKALPDGQILYRIIGDMDKRDFFNDEEWSIYQLISDFASGDKLMFLKNRNLYIEKISRELSSALVLVQNKRYNVFDEEMAITTAQAFKNDNNYGKQVFVTYFKHIWMHNIQSHEMRIEDGINGFKKLKGLLENLLDTIPKYKTFEALHTKNFIQSIDEIIQAFGNE